MLQWTLSTVQWQGLRAARGALRVGEQQAADEVVRQSAQLLERILLRAAVVDARDVVVRVSRRLAAERRDACQSARGSRVTTLVVRAASVRVYVRVQ